MPLETATYIDGLVTTNPIHTDDLSTFDSHLRLLKSTIKATFPNLSAPVTATAVDLNGVVGAFNLTAGTATVPIPTGSTTTGGSVVLKGAGSHPDITLTNASGQLVVAIGGSTALTVVVAGSTFAGTLTASTILQGGNALLPSGVIIRWSGSVATIPLGYVLCDGNNSTPDLRGSFVPGAGGSYVPGSTGGTDTQTATTASAGSHNHTGSTGSAGAHTPTGTLDTQGGHQHLTVTQDHTLTITEIPSHTHEQQLGQGSGGGQNAWSVAGGSTLNDMGIATQATGGGAPHSHGIYFDGAHTHNVTLDGVSAHVHSIGSDGAHTHSVSFDNRPKFYALCFIMKT